MVPQAVLRCSLDLLTWPRDFGEALLINRNLYPCVKVNFQERLEILTFSADSAALNLDQHLQVMGWLQVQQETPKFSAIPEPVNQVNQLGLLLQVGFLLPWALVGRCVDLLKRPRDSVEVILMNRDLHPRVKVEL